jgi:D-alanine-D-alanine ligase
MKSLKIQQPGEFGKVGVLVGGTAAEREISLKSGQAVFEALLEQGVDAVAIDITGNPITALQAHQLDRVFNIIHGRGGEDGVMQAILQTLGLPYTGSGVLASALSMDKLRTKLCWQGLGLPTPRWFQLRDEQDLDDCIAHLGFPMIVKPAQEGSSIGMSKAHNREELAAALKLAAGFRCDVYAEQWIQGEEYTVAILDEEALPAIRLQTPNEFYDFDAKYRANTTQYHCPCGLSSEREQQLQRLAEQACKGLGIRGWARVDVFIDGDGDAQLIEVNTVPGMTDHSLVPMAAKAAGISFNELVWRILQTSWAD